MLTLFSISKSGSFNPTTSYVGSVIAAANISGGSASGKCANVGKTLYECVMCGIKGRSLPLMLKNEKWWSVATV